jgi:hypothetical protein
VLNDSAQVAACIRSCNSNFVRSEELLELIPMHEILTGEIFCDINNLPKQ